MAWLHYIGGRYTPARFVREAHQYGVSRRIPARLLKAIAWGDKVYCAVWRGSLSKNGINIMEGFGEGEEKAEKFKEGRAEIFALFTVDRIVIEDHEVNATVQMRLREAGLIQEEWSGSGKLIRRACGYYYEGGSVTVRADVTIAKIAEIAFEVATGRQFHVMIQGQIRKVYAPPRPLAVPFTRGLIRIEDFDSEGVVDISAEHAIAAIRNHVVAKKKDDFTIGKLL